MTPPRAGGRLLVLYTFTTFLGASLLFLVEPMVAKMLLPRLGGTPAVWNTATVFFQAVLLAGYAFAHVSLTRLGVRRQRILQIVALLVPLLLLPVALPAGWEFPSGANPAGWTLLVLTLMVGAPFFMLATSGPTLQRWFSVTGHPHAGDPYFLYAAGNVGSLLALLAYPTLVEPFLALDDQSRLWSALYLGFVACTAACALSLRRGGVTAIVEPVQPGGPATVPPPRIDNRTRLRWIGLAAVPSALLLGVTRHVAADVASMPLLWVVPLSLYLLTFIIAFGRRPEPTVRVSARALKLLVIPLALSLFGLVAALWAVLALNLAVFFAAALVAHGRLSAERPESARLTEFYLLLSTGGVIGGLLAALVAPVVFSTVLEYPLAIVAALVVLPASAFTTTGRARPRALSIGLGVAVVAGTALSLVIRADATQQALTLSILVAAGVAVGAFVLARTPLAYAGCLAALLLTAPLLPANPTLDQVRTFFGVHRVYDDALVPGRHVLLNGTTVHGMEDTAGATAGQPTTYYHPTGPIGQFFAARDEARPMRVGLVGLGSGALAAYGQPGDHFTYYEIDPAVVDIAKDPGLFTFVRDSEAQVDFVVGDGRLELEDAPDEKFDLLVVDAFSGDGIPLHLITDEAMALYRSRLADGGVIAFHISNRYFDFAPVLGRLSEAHDLAGVVQEGTVNDQDAAEGKLAATWVLLAPDAGRLRSLGADWRPLGDGDGAPLWTDQYSDLLHVFRWEGS